MTRTDKTTLKNYFKTGDIPTEDHFASLIEGLTDHVYTPEQFGAIGDGINDDTVAIQDAIDAASVQGGIVQLSQVYRITVRVTGATVGGYACDYCLRVTANNVHIKGPGTLVMREKQESQRLIVLLFGIGGNVEFGPWTTSVGIDGVTFDGMDISAADRAAMQTLEAGIFTFASTRYFYATNCMIRGGWGFQGAIGGFASCRYGIVVGNVLHDSDGRGIGFDGGRFISISNNIMHLLRSGGVGISFQSNLDNGVHGVCTNNAAVGNVIHGVSQGLLICGCSQSVFVGNHIYDPTASAGVIRIASYSHAQGKAESSNNLIMGNYIGRDSTNPNGYIFYIGGQDINNYDGTPLPVRQNLIQGNIISELSRFGLGLYSFGEQSRNNRIRDNSFDSVGIFDEDDTTPSVTGYDVWKTNNANATTITTLDDGYIGQRITIIIGDINTTIDFTGTNLKGNGGTDWSPSIGDFMQCVFDGINWSCAVTAVS